MLTNKMFYGVCMDCNEYIETDNVNNAECPKCGPKAWFKTVGRVGKCVCGEEVEFSRFTNTCDNCGRDYNGSGEELACRSQWGEETGENLSDIMRIR